VSKKNKNEHQLTKAPTANQLAMKTVYFIIDFLLHAVFSLHIKGEG